jgi:hypothetical protein
MFLVTLLVIVFIMLVILKVIVDSITYVEISLCEMVKKCLGTEL